MAMYAGWTYKGRPFSKAEFNKSYLKKNTGISYSEYLTSYARQVRTAKRKAVRKTTTPVRRSKNKDPFDFLNGLM